MKSEFLDELIERATRKAGSGKALAEILEVSATVVSDWKSGRKACNAEDQALMASIAGLNGINWGSRALIAKHAGTSKGEKLEEALKNAITETLGIMSSCEQSKAKNFSQEIDYSNPELDRRRSTMGPAPYPNTPQTRLTLIATGLS